MRAVKPRKVSAKKLFMASLIAFLLPVFWVVGAKSSVSLTPQEKNISEARIAIMQSLMQINNVFRMMPASHRQIDGARAVQAAGERVQQMANQSSDYFRLQRYVNDMKKLKDAAAVLRGLE